MTTTLYQYWRSSASWRVRWALAIKGVPFTAVVVNIVEGAQLTEEHRARNPIGHVPALHIDGVMLAESVAILEYLEETRPTPALYPRDAVGRARVRQLVELVNAGVQPLQNLVTMARHSADGAEQKSWVQHFNARGLAAFERVLEGLAREGHNKGSFAYGTELTAADLLLVPQVATARRFGVDLSGLPLVLAAEKAALATEHATGALPESQADAPKAR